MGMNKEKLIQKLKVLQGQRDIEATHIEADELLLQFIDDKDITKEYNAIDKYYV